jgi:hypothetical protein
MGGQCSDFESVVNADAGYERGRVCRFVINWTFSLLARTSFQQFTYQDRMCCRHTTHLRLLQTPVDMFSV